jgi:hypothetical protein
MKNFRAVLALSILLAPAAWSETPNLPTVEGRIIELCNEVRKQNGLGPLLPSNSLHTAAVKHSQDMWSGKFFAHTNPQTPANTLSARVRLAGGTSLACAENIYKCEGYKVDQVAKGAVDAWLASPGHRANLLNPKYNRIGVGVVGEKNTYVFTQDFATEAIEVLSYQVSKGENGYQLQLRGKVVEGPREGAILFQSKRVGNWTASDDGTFEATATLPSLGEVQIGQTVAPRNWAIETVLDVFSINS